MRLLFLLLLFPLTSAAIEQGPCGADVMLRQLVQSNFHLASTHTLTEQEKNAFQTLTQLLKQQTWKGEGQNLRCPANFKHAKVTPHTTRYNLRFENNPAGGLDIVIDSFDLYNKLKRRDRVRLMSESGFLVGKISDSRLRLFESYYVKQPKAIQLREVLVDLRYADKKIYLELKSFAQGEVASHQKMILHPGT